MCEVFENVCNMMLPHSVTALRPSKCVANLLKKL